MFGGYALIVLAGFLSGIFFIRLLRKFSLKYNLLSPKGIPLVGGLGMGLSFIIVFLLSLFLYGCAWKELLGIVISSLTMLIFGAIDDWRELSIWAKFLAQIISTALLFYFGVRTQIINIGNFLNIIITFIWVLGITNAFNHLDVTDGLASGAAIIVAFSFFVISILNGDLQTAILSLALIGVLLGFFLYNFPPAKVYMGNAGSHFLGFLLAAIALNISYAPLERKVALLSPILILGLPLFDTAFLVLMRMIKRHLPFNKSNDHLVLRYLARGYSKKKALFTMLSLSLFFCLCGIAVSQAPNIIGITIVAFAILVSFILFVRMSKVAVHG